MPADFLLDGLEQALNSRQPERNSLLTHRSSRGSQYVSVRGNGDSHDNALAEAINEPYNAETSTAAHLEGP